MINEVVDVLDAKQIQAMIEKNCGAQNIIIDASSEFAFILTKK